MLFDNNCGPAMLVLDGAILNTTEGVVQVLGDRTRFIAKVIALACVEVVDIADRTDYRSSSTIPAYSMLKFEIVLKGWYTDGKWIKK